MAKQIVAIVGRPNVGKSTFINKMAKNNIAKTGDRPGVTKSKQWIKTPLGIEMLDTPGVLWPKFEDERTALNLAFTGAIKDEIMDTEELSYRLVERLQKHYANEIFSDGYCASQVMSTPSFLKVCSSECGSITVE
mgnify:FL=1